MGTKVVKTFSKENKLSHDDVLNFTVKTVVLGDESNDFYNQVSDGINFVVKKTGLLHLYNLSGDGGSICFEPGELDFLKRALDAAIVQKKKAKLS